MKPLTAYCLAITGDPTLKLGTPEGIMTFQIETIFCLFNT